MSKNALAYLVLRVGVAFAFLYASLDAFVDPFSWIDFFPRFVRGIVPDLTLLHAFAVIEIVIALWILSGKKIFIPTALATVLLVSIVVFNLSEFQFLFRDLSIAAAALALAVMSAPSMRRGA